RPGCRAWSGSSAADRPGTDRRGWALEGDWTARVLVSAGIESPPLPVGRLMTRSFCPTRPRGALALSALLAAGLVAGALASVADAAPVAFAPAQSFPANPNPVYVVAADLNRDGKPDLAVANGTP